MKVSELTNYIAPIDSTANGQSHLAFNYQDTSEGTPGTYRITFENLGKALSNGMGFLYPDIDHQALKKYAINDEAYTVNTMGYYLSNVQLAKLNEISTQANKSDIAYDSTNKKITKTIDGTTYEVVTAATLKTDMSLNNVENKSAATILSELTIDSTPTANSSHPVSSGGVASAISGFYTKPNGGIPSTDLADTYLTSFTETDPTVPAWAKASSKPTYSISEMSDVAAPTFTTSITIGQTTLTEAQLQALIALIPTNESQEE